MVGMLGFLDYFSAMGGNRDPRRDDHFIAVAAVQLGRASAWLD
jgi:hypothetical protein